MTEKFGRKEAEKLVQKLIWKYGVSHDGCPGFTIIGGIYCGKDKEFDGESTIYVETTGKTEKGPGYFSVRASTDLKRPGINNMAIVYSVATTDVDGKDAEELYELVKKLYDEEDKRPVLEAKTGATKTLLDFLEN